MDLKSQVPQSDDEEDLEALRIAALQSLKKNAVSSQTPNSNFRDNSFRQRFRPENSLDSFTSSSGRFHSDQRRTNSNLTQIPMKRPVPRNHEPVFRLPQDKYTTQIEQTGKKSDSKFDRYNDTDKSEEEDSEDELLKLNSDEEDDSSIKLERTDSLEALMQELDDEIKGNNKVKIETDKGRPKKIKAESIKVEADETTPEEPTSSTTVKSEEVEVTSTESPVVKGEETVVQEPTSQVQTLESTKQRAPYVRKRPRSPFQRGRFHNKRGKQNNFRPPPLHLHVPPFIVNSGPLPFHPNIPPPPMFTNPQFIPPNAIPIIPPLYNRPLSPLLINAETLQTQTMAPLSPRSAAFVLENRAIIEKRKRSPRRSYSRSPSPRSRSLSPRRSRSPPAVRKRTLSPPMRKRSPSPLRKRSRSPRRRSLSPKRRNLSPKGRVFSPKRKSPSPRRRSLSPKRVDKKDVKDAGPKSKPSIRERLGLKSNTKTEEVENKEKLTDSPKKDDKFLDPILEARKRKFESKEINVREGIIRLRPRDEPKPREEPDVEKSQPEVVVKPETIIKPEPIKTETVEVPAAEEASTNKDTKPATSGVDEFNEDALLEDDELDLEAQVDLFSEEDFDSDEAEAQVSTNKETVRIVQELPETASIPNGKRNKIRLSPDKSPTKDRIPKEKSRSRKSVMKKLKSSKSPSSSKKLSVKAERHPKKFDRKIEIKIKNPSKYERGVAMDAEKGKRPRKVEVDGVDLQEFEDFLNEDDDDTEIVVEGENETENTVSSEGDLRAQLSKKRAEKLHHKTKKSSQDVASRLLQNALENALPIKKSKKSKDLTNSEGKLPIHLRLGIEYGSDIFASSKPKRRSKKRKNLEDEPQ